MNKQQLFCDISLLIEEFKRLSNGAINYDKLALYISLFHSTSIDGCTFIEKEVIDLSLVFKQDKIMYFDSLEKSR